MEKENWKTMPSSIIIGTKVLENTTLHQLFLEKVNALRTLDYTLTSFYESIENMLSATIGHLPHNEIKKRCKVVSHIGDFPFKQEYYLDDKLIFVAEIKLGDSKLFLEILKPGEVQDER